MVIAVGFFDGVHLGHQAILQGSDLALTFADHPLARLRPELAPRLIMSCDQRVKAIESLGIRVRLLNFDERIRGLSPLEFVKLLADMSREKRRLVGAAGFSLRCGENWRFGKGGEGTPEWLRSQGVAVTVVRYAQYGGERISSTRIRRVIESGDLKSAAAMMGRPFAVGGEVFAGKGEGGRLGYPTVNVRPQNLGLRLPLGVYAAEAEGCAALVNYGLAPTMGERAWREPVLELHFLNRLPKAVDSRMEVRMLDFIRPERRFESIAELKAQIALDLVRVRFS